jgi:hypothetical protein
MASRSTIEQIATMAFIEGSFNMLWEQRYQDRPDNATFAKLHRSLTSATAAAILRLGRESGGISLRERSRLDRQLEAFKLQAFPNPSIGIIEIISIALDLLNGILRKLPEGSPKYALTDTVWRRLRAMERYYNRKGNYDNPADLIKADIYKKVIRE